MNDIRTRALRLVHTSTALSDKTIMDLKTVLGDEVLKDHLYSCSNHHLRAEICVKCNICPKNPTDILRCIVFKLTGQALLIKNAWLVNQLRECESQDITIWLSPKLARIFYRYKPLLLPLKRLGHGQFINRLRRMAPKWHTPVKRGVLLEARLHPINDVIKVLERSSGAKLKASKIIKSLSQPPPIFFLRNGSSWVSDRQNSAEHKSATMLATWLANKIKITAPEVVISPGTELALPSSERMFIGNFPVGTRFSAEAGFMVGIHWSDEETDLDISAVGHQDKVGWNAERVTPEMLFSGDLVSGVGGATEIIKVIKDDAEPAIIYCSPYRNSCDYKLLLGHSDRLTAPENCIQSNDLIAEIEMDNHEKEMILGVLANSVFTLVGRQAAKSKVSRWTLYSDGIMDIGVKLAMITLNDVLHIKDGVKVVTTPTPGQDYLDLRNDVITKEAILELFKD